MVAYKKKLGHSTPNSKPIKKAYQLKNITKMVENFGSESREILGGLTFGAFILIIGVKSVGRKSVIELRAIYLNIQQSPLIYSTPSPNKNQQRGRSDA
jgi:archaellum biogenesis ATPase FlaH